MAGSWYVIAGTNPMLRRFDLSLHEDILITEGFGRKDGECTLLFTHTGTSVLHKNNGELLISFQNQEYRGYFTGKVIYTDYQVAVLYLCEDETIHGECLEYRVSILSRTQTLDSMGRSLLEAKLKLSCGDLSSNLTQITDHCEKEQSCRIDDIQAVENLDIRKILGIWYIIKNTNKLNTSDSSALKFNLDEDGHIHLKFTTLQSDGTCVQPPYYSYMKRRNDPGDFLSTTLSKYSKPGFHPFKILFTDYENTMVTYICIDIQANGQCGEKGKRLSILSRTQSITQETKTGFLRFVDLACVNRNDIIEVKHEVDCSSAL